jgi:hypothetical protein
MANIIKLFLKKPSRFFLRKLTKRSYLVVDSYLRLRFGMDLDTLITVYKTRLNAFQRKKWLANSANFSTRHRIELFKKQSNYRKTLPSLPKLNYFLKKFSRF